jgi:hypothetical protein
MVYRRSMPQIEIDGRYAYETDLELEVGDEVLLPAGWSGEWVGMVTALSSEYGGLCGRVVRLVRKRADAEQRDAELAAVAITGFRAGSIVRVKASCGHEVLLRVREVNRVGRPTHVEGRCDRCRVPFSAYLGSANAWRWYAAGSS